MARAKKAVLVYRLGSLGDTIVALPCFHLIRRVFPEHEVVLLTNMPVSGKAAPAETILTDGGLIDRAIGYPVGTRSWKELRQVRDRVRDAEPSLIVNLPAGRGWLAALRDHSFLAYCGKCRVIGTPYARSDSGPSRLRQGRYERESDRLARRLKSLGDAGTENPGHWDLKLTPGEREEARKLLGDTRSPRIAVSVGTKSQVNDYGTEKWSVVIEKLGRQIREATLVFVGAGDEHAASGRLASMWPGSTLNLCGKTSPRVLAAVLQETRLFIGHDSGPMHLAAAAGTAVVGLFSWNNPPGQWFPGHEQWPRIRTLYPPLPPGGWKEELRGRRSPGEGILLIDPEEAAAAALDLLRDPRVLEA